MAGTSRGGRKLIATTTETRTLGSRTPVVLVSFGMLTVIPLGGEACADRFEKVGIPTPVKCMGNALAQPE